MTTIEAMHRINCGWYVCDDDYPRPPEVDPLSSAQARRFWNQLPPADRLQGEPYGRHAPQDATAAADACAMEVLPR